MLKRYAYAQDRPIICKHFDEKRKIAIEQNIMYT